jgi:hypothetical protein
MHVALAYIRYGEGDHFGSYVRSISLYFCKRLFPELKLMTLWSQDNSFTTASGLPFLLPNMSLLKTP